MLQHHAGKQPAPAAAAVADIMDRTVNTDDPILNREQRYESRIRIRAFLTFARLINSCFFFQWDLSYYHQFMASQSTKLAALVKQTIIHVSWLARL